MKGLLKMKHGNPRSGEIRGENDLHVRSAYYSPCREMQQLLRESDSPWAVEARKVMNAVNNMKTAREAGHGL